MQALNALNKVTTFITRQGLKGLELIDFRHPNAGIQIPAGTLEAGKADRDAALRKAVEEIGLRELRFITQIDAREGMLPGASHGMLRNTHAYACPTLANIDSTPLKPSALVRMLREENGFVQVIFEKMDQYLRKLCSLSYHWLGGLTLQ